MKRFNRAVLCSIFSVAVGAVPSPMAGHFLEQPSLPGKPEPTSEHAQKLTATAIQIESTDMSNDLIVPEDFRVSMYENVVRQVAKTKKFKYVYRSGDRTAADVPDLIVMHLIPEAFKEGSQKQREVTTVTGFSSIKVKVQITSRDGKVLLDKDLIGRVRFYGENLRVTYDLSRKVAHLVNDTF